MKSPSQLSWSPFPSTQELLVFQAAVNHPLHVDASVHPHMNCSLLQVLTTYGAMSERSFSTCVSSFIWLCDVSPNRCAI